MSTRTFQIGDIVKLKSGGPKMTVSSFSTTGVSLTCQWFAGSKLEAGHFDPETLVKGEEEEKKN